MTRIQVEVFTAPGCGKCGKTKDVLRKLAEEIGAGRVKWREVNVLEELDYAVNLGVLSTPAIAINGELTFTGLPSVGKLRTELNRRLVVEGGARHA